MTTGEMKDGMVGSVAPNAGATQRSNAEATALASSVTALVVNYKTLELTQRCIQTLVTHYPLLPIVLIDNGSGDASSAFIAQVASEHENVRSHMNARNLYHGPALDQGMRLADTPYVLTLDSDCEILDGGFIESMLREFDDPALYALGELRYKNRFGYTYGYWYSEPRAGWIPYVHPYAMLVDRGKYLDLPPFVHHGAPCIKNMRGARRAGYSVRHFPIYDFVRHHLRGTSIAHGYGLRGRLRLEAGYYVSKVYDRIVGERSVAIEYPPQTADGTSTPRDAAD
jgi:glycosyltransferase involved in cell wall biosynthesis